MTQSSLVEKAALEEEPIGIKRPKNSHNEDLGPDVEELIRSWGKLTDKTKKDNEVLNKVSQELDKWKACLGRKENAVYKAEWR